MGASSSKPNKRVTRSSITPTPTRRSRPTNSATEVTAAKTEFDKRLTNPVTFFIFPYDYWNTRRSRPSVRPAIWARAPATVTTTTASTTRRSTRPNPPTISRSSSTSGRAATRSTRATAPKRCLRFHAWQAIDRAAGRCASFTASRQRKAPRGRLAGLRPGAARRLSSASRFPVCRLARESDLDEPPSRIIRYRHARTACKASVAAAISEFDTSNPDCAKYQTPISSVVETGQDPEHPGASSRATRRDPQDRAEDVLGDGEPDARRREAQRLQLAGSQRRRRSHRFRPPDACGQRLRDRKHRGRRRQRQDGRPRAHGGGLQLLPIRRSTTAAREAGPGTRRTRRSAFERDAPTRCYVTRPRISSRGAA